MNQELGSSFDRWLKAGTAVMVVLAFGLIYWAAQRRAETGVDPEQHRQRLEMAPMKAKALAGMPLSLFDREELRVLGTLVYATREPPEVRPVPPQQPSGPPPDDAPARELRDLKIEYEADLATWRKSIDNREVDAEDVVTVYVPEPGETVSFIVLDTNSERAKELADSWWKSGLIKAASLYDMQPAEGSGSGLRLVTENATRSIYWGGLELYRDGELVAGDDELEMLAERRYYEQGPPPVEEEPEDSDASDTGLPAPDG